jgi:HK97 family phage major capsid protein
MMHDTTLKAIAKLDIGTNDARPLWQPSMITGQPDTIEGKRFFINMAMEEIGASNEIMIFGDLIKFVIRKVLGTTLFVYREKYMDYLQVGFQAYSRWDSRLLDAGTYPIKVLVHSAT